MLVLPLGGLEPPPTGNPGSTPNSHNPGSTPNSHKEVVCIFTIVTVVQVMAN